VSLKVDKPPTPNIEKIAPEPSKPLSPGGVQSSPGASGALSPSAKAAPSTNSAGAPPSPKMVESAKTSPPSPWSFGIGSVGSPSLANDPGFIKARLHIGRFITVAVDTEADRTNIKALYTDLESTSTRLNVSIFHLTFCNHSCRILTPLFIQKLVEHSPSKDQFLGVAIKRFTKTQLFEDKSKEVSDLNTILLARN
jgi:hypothetical protein